MKQIFTKMALLLFLIALTNCRQKASDSIELTGWKFQVGDDLSWCIPDWDDSNWKTIQTNTIWENQGYTNYNGYGWDRIKFNLPKSLKDNALYKDTFQIVLGKIDDQDEVFLNGEFIGTNNHLCSLSQAPDFQKNTAYNVYRIYKLSPDDPRLKWGQENTLAVRVLDTGGGGGIYEGVTSVGFKELKDYLKMDPAGSGITALDSSNYQGTVEFQNLASFTGFQGKLKIEIIEFETQKVVINNENEIEVPANGKISFTYKLPKDFSKQYIAEFTFKESKSGVILKDTRDLPYILTPKAPATPRINGPRVFAVRPGKPLLFLVPVSGQKPIKYEVDPASLPEGVTLDNETGIISGRIAKPGEYTLKLTAKNEKGESSRDLKIVVGDKLSLTPPMGWNSWNCWGLSVDEDKMKSTIDIFIDKGLADYGWAYVNIDDGWESAVRRPDGSIAVNEKFGNMKELSNYAHSRGLKLGIYSSPGPRTCGGFLGSYQYEQKDAKTYAEWGIDYLKYDWCAYSEICPNPKSLEDFQKPYIVMKEALDKLDRDIVYSLCQYGMGNVWEWGGNIGGQLWRTTGDIVDTWESLSGIGFNQAICAPYTQPGNWNDPDMLIVGHVGWGPRLHPTRLTANEQYTHISLWSLLSAPLLLGCDLSKLDEFTLNLLTNNEVIDIDQDIAGKPAIFAVKNDKYCVVYKELFDGSLAVGLFNLSKEVQTISTSWKDLKITGEQVARDVWRQKDLGSFKDEYQTKIAPHGVVLVKLTNTGN